MDPFSAAATVIGVVGVAIQLAQAAFTLINFLDTITNAPEEVVRIRCLLNAIYSGSVRIKKVLKQQHAYYVGDESSEEEISNALVECHKRVVKMHRILNKIGDFHLENSKIARSWAKLKVALKKDDIIEIERQLMQDLNVLQLFLQMSTININARNNGIIVERLDNIALQLPQWHHISDGHPPTYEEKSFREITWSEGFANEICRASQHGKAERITVASTTTMCIPLLGSLETTKKCTRSIHRSAASRDFETESATVAYRIKSLWLSKSIELIISRSGCCAPSFSIKAQHIITIEAFHHKMEKLFYKDDVAGLQRLITNGECTIDSCLETNWSLIDLAEDHGAHEIATFLHQQGCLVGAGLACHTLTEHDASRSHQQFELICSRLDLSELEPYDIIPNPHNVNWGYSGVLIFDAIEYLSLVGLKATNTSWRVYLGHLLCLICSWWNEAKTIRVKERRNRLAQKLIFRGADIHIVDQYGHTPLRNLIWSSNPGEDESMMAEWQEILTICNVDMPSYWREECQINQNAFELRISEESYSAWRQYTCIRLRKLTITEFPDGSVFPVLLQWLHPQGRANCLLQEYIFNPDVVVNAGMCQMGTAWLSSALSDECHVTAGGNSIYECVFRWLDKTAENVTHADKSHSDARDWYERFEHYSAADDLISLARMLVEDCRHLCHCDLGGSYIDLWPFYGSTHTMCHSGNILGKGCLNPDFWCKMHACHFNHKRYARKQKKKQDKRMKRVGIQLGYSAIPGAWINS